MNRLRATVKQIQNVDALYVVTFEWYGSNIKMVSLDLKQQLNVGDRVILGVNFTSVAVAKSLNGELSYTNQLEAKVSEVEKGELLSVVKLSFVEASLQSLILSDSVERLDLKAGDKVTMIIKANDIFLMEVLS